MYIIVSESKHNQFFRFVSGGLAKQALVSWVLYLYYDHLLEPTSKSVLLSMSMSYLYVTAIIYESNVW